MGSAWYWVTFCGDGWNGAAESGDGETATGPVGPSSGDPGATAESGMAAPGEAGTAGCWSSGEPPCSTALNDELRC